MLSLCFMFSWCAQTLKHYLGVVGIAIIQCREMSDKFELKVSWLLVWSGSDEELAEEPVSDDDEDYHDAELAPPDCGNGQLLASEGQNETGSAWSGSFGLAVSSTVLSYFTKGRLNLWH